MRIENVRIEKNGDRPRLAATVTWEDCAQLVREVFFETEELLASALSAQPDAFVAASLTPAMWAGEKRIAVADPVCPELVENLEVAARTLHHWFKPHDTVPKIEARRRSAPHSGGSRRAACFFSGGVDSLAVLRANRLNYPRDHPGSIQDGFLVFGLEVEDPAAFGYVLEPLAELARDAGITLIRVATNVRVLNPDWVFWYNAYMGPALCAVAHAFSRRCSSAVIASDYDVPNLKPHGSHPLIEPHFGGYEMRIHYGATTLTRLERTRLLADWPVALRNLRVCNKPELYAPGRLNCGQCEKCIRTMLALLAVGALDRATAFPARDVSPGQIAEMHVSEKVFAFYEELIEPLSVRGRNDLVQAIRSRLNAARGEIGLKGRLRRYDRLRLNGSLKNLKRSLRGTR